MSAHLQPERPQVNRGGNSREMPAHEEGIVGRQIVMEVAQRSFQLRRTISEQNQVRLLRISNQLAGGRFSGKSFKSWTRRCFSRKPKSAAPCSEPAKPSQQRHEATPIDAARVSGQHRSHGFSQKKA